MATVSTLIISDDIDGTEGASTVLFGLDGVNYEIDLSPENEAVVRAALAPLVEKARKVTGKGKAKGKAPAKSTSNASKVREWAAANGYEVGARGRIPADVTEAYAKANPEG
jgi:hypothetical protein